MFHCLAWFASVTNNVETDLTPVQDGIIAISNNHFLPQRNSQILLAWASSVNLQRARLITPKLRQVTTPFLRPTGAALLPPNLPPIADYVMNPLSVAGLEELQLNVFQSGAGAENVHAIAYLSDGVNTPAPQGDIYTMRGTGTTTVTANAWTQAPITWQDTLPAGVYAAIGLSGVSTTGIAARLIFEQQAWRPGGLMFATDGLIASKLMVKGGTGDWGHFTGNRMPSVEVFCNAADTAQEIFLDFVKIG